MKKCTKYFPAFHRFFHTNRVLKLFDELFQKTLDKVYRETIYFKRNISANDIKTSDRIHGVFQYGNLALTESTIISCCLFTIAARLWHHAADGAAFRWQSSSCRRDIVWCIDLSMRKRLDPSPARESGSRKKEYQLTAEGVQVLKHELARLQQLVANGESILKEEAL